MAAITPATSGQSGEGSAKAFQSANPTTSKQTSASAYKIFFVIRMLHGYTGLQYRPLSLEQARGEYIMTVPLAEASDRRAILELWWLLARRAACGQNYAAVRFARYDAQFTIINIVLPLLAFALGFCASVSSRFDSLSWLRYSDLMTLVTALLLATSSLQFAGGHKAKSIEFRQAANEFEALAQQIEATGFTLGDDLEFSNLANSFERIRRSVRQVPAKDWDPVKREFDAQIVEARDRVRKRSSE